MANNVYVIDIFTRYSVTFFVFIYCEMKRRRGLNAVGGGGLAAAENLNVGIFS